MVGGFGPTVCVVGVTPSLCSGRPHWLVFPLRDVNLRPCRGSATRAPEGARCGWWVAPPPAVLLEHVGFISVAGSERVVHGWGAKNRHGPCAKSGNAALAAGVAPPMRAWVTHPATSVGSTVLSLAPGPGSSRPRSSRPNPPTPSGRSAFTIELGATHQHLALAPHTTPRGTAPRRPKLRRRRLQCNAIQHVG